MTLRISVTGVIPVVQPDGKLVLAFWSGRTGMVAVSSTDGGLSLGSPVTISDLRRAGHAASTGASLIAAEVDAKGRIVAVWQDCRFNAGCAANDVVLSRSTDGTTWSPPVRVTSGRNAVMPTLGVEPGHRPDRDRVLRDPAERDRCGARHVHRRRPVERAAAPQPAADAAGLAARDDARPNARRLHRRQLVRGRPLVVYALASPPKQDEFRQAIYAAKG